MQACTCQASNRGAIPHTAVGMLRTRLKTHARRSRGGFTLLEMIVALAVFVIIIAGVFAIAKGSMDLSADLSETQERSMIRQNFIEFLRESFRRVPGDADITLDVKTSRGAYVPTVSVFNGGDAFTPGPPISPDESVDLFATEMPGGYLRVALRHVDADETSRRRNALGSGPGTGTSSRRSGGGAAESVLPLIDHVGTFEWQFYDAQQQKWVNKWTGPGRPLFAELKFALDDGEVSRSVFWIPPVLKRPLNGAAVPGQPAAVGPDGQPIPNAAAPGTTPTLTPPGTAR